MENIQPIGTVNYDSLDCILEYMAQRQWPISEKDILEYMLINERTRRSHGQQLLQRLIRDRYFERMWDYFYNITPEGIDFINDGGYKADVIRKAQARARKREIEDLQERVGRTTIRYNIANVIGVFLAVIFSIASLSISLNKNSSSSTTPSQVWFQHTQIDTSKGIPAAMKTDSSRDKNPKHQAPSSNSH